MVPGLHGAFFSSLLSSASNVTGKKKKKKSKKANLTFCSWKVASHLFLTFFFSTFKKLGLRFPTICFARQHLANEDQTS